MDPATFELLALTLVPGLGTTRLHRLLDRYGSANRILRLQRAQLRKLGLAPETQAYLASGGPFREAEQIAERLRSGNVRLLSYFSEDYPHLLRQIYDPPLILYLQGDCDCLHEPSVAVVGSRRCSVYGREVTQKIARELASIGLTVVSGLARGIDAQAHRGALQAGGKTVAVLGSGINVVYPREHRKLYLDIRTAGCIISEFPLDAYPAPQNFPIRNRIISGLCHGTLIPEAAEFSGSLITARLTLEQNRELWAVPGNITSPQSYGPNYLIKQGAKPVLTAQDILDELPVHVLHLLAKETREFSHHPLDNHLSPDEKRLIQLLSPERKTHFDQLLEATKMGISELNAVLLQLETKGLITQEPGRQFSRKL